MYADTVYDKWFCMKCKFMQTYYTGLQFRVNVVPDCTALTCTSADGAGVFYDFTDPENLVFRFMQIFQIGTT